MCVCARPETLGGFLVARRSPRLARVRGWADAIKWVLGVVRLAGSGLWEAFNKLGREEWLCFDWLSRLQAVFGTLVVLELSAEKSPQVGVDYWGWEMCGQVKSLVNRCNIKQSSLTNNKDKTVAQYSHGFWIMSWLLMLNEKPPCENNLRQIIYSSTRVQILTLIMPQSDAYDSSFGVLEWKLLPRRN